MDFTSEHCKEFGPLVDEVKGFENLTTECDGLLDNEGLGLKFTVIKEEIYISRVFGDFFACVWVSKKNGLDLK